MRFFIEHSYKGTHFHGWQSQPNANSIQAELELALSTLLKTTIEIVGSSRTDAGVHASQQFAHFDLEPGRFIENLDLLTYRLNALLPKDIAVKQVFQVKDSTHARFDASHRTYHYKILQHKNPFLYDTAYYFRQKLDLEQMNLAGKILKLHKDYQAFSKVHTDVRTFNCTIDLAQWRQEEELLTFEIKADRFLRGMVRAIVGTMIEIGSNRLSLDDFEKIILSKNRNSAGRSVPPEGLTLVKVGYPFLD